ncbi:MAG: hypothetical protein ACTSYW_01495 [Candidatus Heimdallarchaeota archaeon]
MKVICNVCGNLINIVKEKVSKKLTIDDWKKGAEKRKLTLRLSIEELEFLDKYAGWGKRATLCRSLLKEYISREEEFVEIISRQLEVPQEMAVV